MKISVRIIFIFFLSVFFFLTFNRAAFAQITTPVPQTAPNPYAQPEINPDVPKNLHTWTQTVMIEVLAGLVCQLSGVDPINPSQPCLGIDMQTKKIGFMQQNGGLVGATGNMIASLYTSPVHTDDYTRYLASNFGITKPAYAQAPCTAEGTGFCGLSPMLRLWTSFRDIVYLLFVLVFIIVGLAIMLRVKIDPRTVMSIENSIPKIIIGILLVTFSYAIAGFMVDMMWVGTYLTVNVLSSAATVPDFSSQTQRQAIDIGRVTDNIHTPPLGFVNELFKDLNLRNQTRSEGSGISFIAVKAAGSMQAIISNLFAPRLGDTFWPGAAGTQLGQCPAGDLTCWIISLNPQVGPILTPIMNLVRNGPPNLGAGFSFIIGNLLSWIVSILAYLVIIIALLFVMFRVWFQLLFAFISIMLDVVLAPFWIIAGAIPGSKYSFGGWIRDLSANLLAFPAVIGMFLLAKTFMEAFATGAPYYFVPPLIGNPGDPQIFGPLIGLGFILYTPRVLGLLKSMLGAQSLPFAPLAASLGLGSSVVGGVVGGAVGQAFKTDQYGNPSAPASFYFHDKVWSPLTKRFGGRFSRWSSYNRARQDATTFGRWRQEEDAERQRRRGQPSGEGQPPPTTPQQP